MSQTLIAAPRRARFARAITTAEAVYATSLSAPAQLHQFYLARLSAQRGPTPAQRRQAHQVAVLQGLIAQEQARLTPNVCLALPLLGRLLVPTTSVRYQ